MESLLAPQPALSYYTSQQDDVFPGALLLAEDPSIATESLTEGASIPLAIESPRIRRSLTYSLLDAVCFSLMLGLGEAYIIPMAVVLGLGSTEIGLISTVPLLLGAASQFLSGALIRAFGSRKRLVVAFVLAQASGFLLFFATVYFQWNNFWGLLSIASLYWASGIAANPAWNSWIGALTEGQARGKYFGLRGQLSNVATLLAFALGGWLLHLFEASHGVTVGYLILFGGAFIARMGSVAFLLLKYEPPLLEADHPSPSELFHDGLEFVHRRKHHLASFLIAMNVGVFFSAAYFTPYMLKELHLSYLAYGLIICTSLAGKIFFLPVWGYYSDIYGARKTLVLSAAFVVVIPWLWWFSNDLWYLCAVQWFSGMVWAGFELSSFNLMLNSTHGPERVAYYSWYNTSNSIGQVAASAMGGWLLGSGLLDYMGLFLGSGVVRLLAFGLLAHTLKEVSTVSEISYRNLFFRILAAKPTMGVILRPIFVGHHREERWSESPSGEKGREAS